jgi:hypothetical protein
LEVFKLTGQRLSHLQTQFEEGRPAHEVKVFVLDWPRQELHRRIETRVRQMFAAGLVEEVRGLIARYGQLSRTARQAVGYREVLRYLGVDMEGTGGGQPTVAADSRRRDASYTEGVDLPLRAQADQHGAGGVPVGEMAPWTADRRRAAQAAGSKSPQEHGAPAAGTGSACERNVFAADAGMVPGRSRTGLADAVPSLDACMQQVLVRTRRFARRQETWFRALSECMRVPWRAGMTAQAMAETILDLARARTGKGSD